MPAKTSQTLHIYPATGLDFGLDYAIPEGMSPPPRGSVVSIRMRNQAALGIVWGPGTLPESDPKHATLKPVESCLSPSPLPESLLTFIDWMADYTLQPRGLITKMALSGYPHPAPRAKKPAKPLSTLPTPQLPELSPSQTEAANELIARLSSGFSTTLLDGVTGSGKTEIYLTAAAEALKSGGQILVLLPEISLSVPWVERFEKRFGIPPILWHSDITPAAKKHAWSQTATSEPCIVVGARSALFLPLPKLSMIIVDEEHDTSYKQEEGVIYHARDLAIARAKLANIPITLASATPSLESLRHAQSGKYHHLLLTERFSGAELPAVQLTDLRQTPPPKGQFLSPPLRQAITDRLSRREQTLLFINRRGYAPLFLCRHCGHRWECLACASTLTLHGKANKHLLCHHCGHRAPTPTACPSCASTDALHPFGPGIERVAEEAAALFPEARIAIFSSDAIDSQAKASTLLTAVANEEIDILVGTQMAAKGYHFPKLTLVGVVDGDAGLECADIRSSERCFQLMHQVSGRAGRESLPGEVLIQTHQPDHPVMQALKHQQRDAFYAAETELRQHAQMPPFGRLASLILSSPDETQLLATARQLALQAPAHPSIRVLGPAPAPLYKTRHQYRLRFLIKSPRSLPQTYLRQWLSSAQLPRSVRLKIDIDPQQFL